MLLSVLNDAKVFLWRATHDLIELNIHWDRSMNYQLVNSLPKPRSSHNITKTIRVWNSLTHECFSNRRTYCMYHFWYTKQYMIN